MKWISRDIILLSLAVMICNTTMAEARDVPFTEADRDRIIRTEARLDEGLKRMEEGFKAIDKRFEAVDKRMEEGFKAVNQRFEGVNQRFEAYNQRLSDIRSEIAGLRDLVYVVIAGIFVLIGFVLWDRRSTISPVVTRVGAIEEEERRIKRVLKTLATRDKKVEDILRQEGLL